MRRKNKTLANGAPTMLLICTLALLTSCGSFQPVSYDNDGIYATTNTPGAAKERAAVGTTTNSVPASSQNEYKDYFAKKSQQYDNIPEEGAVFTDIDSYASEGYTEENTSPQERTEYNNSNGTWGNTYNDTPVVNIYTSGWNNGWGWNRGWGWNTGWGWNAGWGWNRGWNRPWGWNAGWGWNNGGFFCPPFYNNFYGGGYAYNRYNASRYYNARRRNSSVYIGNRYSNNRANTTTGARSAGSSANRGRSSYSVQQGAIRNSSRVNAARNSSGVNARTRSSNTGTRQRSYTRGNSSRNNNTTSSRSRVQSRGTTSNSRNSSARSYSNSRSRSYGNSSSRSSSRSSSGRSSSGRSSSGSSRRR